MSQALSRCHRSRRHQAAFALTTVVHVDYNQVVAAFGFRTVKREILLALEEERVQHEQRAAADEKNLLATGSITPSYASAVVAATSGRQASTSQHHLDPTVCVWILRPTYDGRSWYVKCYLCEDVWFISFHEAERSRLH